MIFPISYFWTNLGPISLLAYFFYFLTKLGPILVELVFRKFCTSPILQTLGFSIEVWQWHYSTKKCRSEGIRGGAFSIRRLPMSRPIKLSVIYIKICSSLPRLRPRTSSAPRNPKILTTMTPRKRKKIQTLKIQVQTIYLWRHASTVTFWMTSCKMIKDLLQ